MIINYLLYDMYVCMYLHLWLHPATTSTQDGLGLLQLALAVLYISSHQLVQIHNFHSSPATCTGGVLYNIYNI